MTILYLVRHAHADYSPDEDRSLSERGRRDAERVAGRLDRLPIAAVYASSARRAWETVAPLAARLGVPIQSVHDLRERELAAGEVDDFQAAVRATWDDPEFAHPGGESNGAAQRRGVAAIRLILQAHPHGQVVAATHGNLLALIAGHFDASLGYPFWQSLTMPDVYRLELEGERLVTMDHLWG
jgi:2,3-bisphosphoglycerate-dependent phosphoglycerate mutase